MSLPRNCLDVDAVYRFLDKLGDAVGQIIFAHTKRILNNTVSVVFYDMTTLHFEVGDEDDLRKTGFSKDAQQFSNILGIVGRFGWLSYWI